MSKLDYKREWSTWYKASTRTVETVTVPAWNFLQISGRGAPGCPAHVEAIEALYSVSYTLKFAIKRSPEGLDYGVMPLEGLWWAEDMSDFVTDNRASWQWTMMILQPPVVTPDRVEAAMAQVRERKGLPGVDRLDYVRFEEGLCAQVLHVGPFSEEGPTVERVHAHIHEQGHSLSGKHHEIYLSDFRRTAPERLRTIIRQPMC